MKFNKDIAEGDLVWFPIFTQFRNTIFYNIEFVPKQKTITAMSVLFMKRRNY
jgi:hypothetical protein